jgi:hypothetical protein
MTRAPLGRPLPGPSAGGLLPCPVSAGGQPANAVDQKTFTGLAGTHAVDSCSPSIRWQQRSQQNPSASRAARGPVRAARSHAERHHRRTGRLTAHWVAGWKRAAPQPEAVAAQPGATGKAELENRTLVSNKSSRNTGRTLIRAPAPPPWTEWRRTRHRQPPNIPACIVAHR